MCLHACLRTHGYLMPISQRPPVHLPTLQQKDKEEYERRVAGIKKVLLASKHLAAGDRVTRKAMVEFLAGKHIGENEVFNDKITEAAAQEGGRTKKRPKRVGEVEVDFNKYITYMTMNGALAAAKADAMLQNRAAAATELTQSEQAQLIEDLGLPMFTAKLPTKNILQDEVEKITGTRPPGSVRKDKLARTLFDHFRSKEREQEGAGGQGGAGT